MKFKLNYKQIVVSLAVIVAIVGTLTWVNAQTSGIQIDPTCQATSVDVFISSNSYDTYSNYLATIKAGDCTMKVWRRIPTVNNVIENAKADFRSIAPTLYVSIDGFNATEVQYRGRFRL